jgi:hypothetical protein
MNKDMAGHFFAKFSNIKFYQNRFIRSAVVSCVQTEGQSGLKGAQQDC